MNPWLFGLFSAFCGLLALVCGWAAVCNTRRWQEGRGRPLITVTAEQLAGLPAEWPLSKRRWPRPSADGGGTPPAIWGAYGRLAERRLRACRLVSQACLVVAGAWLSLRLAPLASAITEDVRASQTGSAALSFERGLTVWRVLLPEIPLIGVFVVGLMTLSLADGYEAVKTEYERAREVPIE
ncbi:hypothetical protein [Geodermatophilus saharensis]|uniref:hypothetical protein n=1 Tax=Geodermatophilus saharensis TaxID=1137994 RepID=UPI000B773D25|nr:hypothetical protein [Geodermatophilus saharensis]